MKRNRVGLLPVVVLGDQGTNNRKDYSLIELIEYTETVVSVFSAFSHHWVIPGKHFLNTLDGNNI